jgi:hypothetical protein
MYTILILIGLFVCFKYFARGLNKFGDFMNVLSSDLADRARTRAKTEAFQDEVLRRQNKKTAEDIRTIKGAESDVNYQSRVKDEIDELCKEISEGPSDV